MPLPGRAAGAFQAEVGGVPDAHQGVRPLREVGGRDSSSGWVAIVGEHAQASTREGAGVRADPATEIVHRPDTGLDEPSCVPGRQLRSGRLLQPVGGEEHPGGLLAELGARPGPQLGLVQGGGDQLRIVTGSPQRGRHCQRPPVRVGRQRLEQGPALMAGQPQHQCRVHASAASPAFLGRDHPFTVALDGSTTRRGGRTHSRRHVVGTRLDRVLIAT